MHRPSDKKKREGFTLIELSIVLVIIGLLAGGVLVGRDLIRAAEIRAQIKQIQDMQVAITTFQGKYNCIPGDCGNITSFLGVADGGNAIVNGNDNGQVDTSDNFSLDSGTLWSTDIELQQSFVQLSATKLIAFKPSTPSNANVGVSHPATVLNPGTGFVFGASYSFFTGGRTPSISAYQTGTNALWFTHCAVSVATGGWDDFCGVFKPADMLAIDSKIDDGKPLSGKVFGFGGYSTNNNCLTGATPSANYDTTYSTPQCQAAIIFN